MKKNDSASIENAIRKLFAEQLLDVVAGLESVFLVDLKTAGVVVAYPEKESQPDAFIGEICGTTAIQIEHLAKSNRASLSLSSMEILTKDNRRIATYRVTPTWLVCMLGKEESFRPAFAKRLCEGPIKDEIESLLAQHNITG